MEWRQRDETPKPRDRDVRQHERAVVLKPAERHPVPRRRQTVRADASYNFV